MATSKTLTPTNVTIQIPAFTDKPDQRVNSNCIDKEADAINALNSNTTGVITSSHTLGSDTSFLVKNVNVVTLVMDITLTSAVSSFGTIATVPNGFKPLKQIVSYAGTKKFDITAGSGAVRLIDGGTNGEKINVAITYIAA